MDAERRAEIRAAAEAVRNLARPCDPMYLAGAVLALLAALEKAEADRDRDAAELSALQAALDVTGVNPEGAMHDVEAIEALAAMRDKNADDWIADRERAEAAEARVRELER